MSVSEHSSPTPKGRERNFIYSKLIIAPDDAVGLIAYGLYKRRKIAYIEKCHEKKKRAPSNEELSVFQEQSLLDVSRYRADAEALVEEVTSKHLADILSEGSKKHDEELKTRLKGSFWKNVGASITGTVLVAVVFGLFYVAMIGQTQGWATVGRRLLDGAQDVGENIDATAKPKILEEAAPQPMPHPANK